MEGNNKLIQRYGKLSKSRNLKNKKLSKFQKLAKLEKKSSKSENSPKFNTKKNGSSFLISKVRTAFNYL